MAISNTGTGTVNVVYPSGGTNTAPSGGYVYPGVWAINSNVNFTAGDVSVSATETGKDIYVTTGGAITLTVSQSWTTRDSGTTSTLNSVVFGGTTYVAGGAAGALSTSTDGITWTTRTSGFGSTNINVVAFGASVFVAAGDSGTLRSSTDGITWTARTTNFGTTNITGLLFGNAQYVATGTAAVRGSTDGITWTSKATSTLTVAGTGPNAIIFDGTKWISGAGSGGGTSFATSTDLVTWTTRTGTVTNPQFAYTTGSYIAVGNPGSSSGVIQTSTDGLTWTTRLSGINPYGALYANSTFLVADSANVLTSTDGITWTTRRTGIQSYAIGTGASSYVVVGATGKIAQTLTANINGVSQGSSWASLSYQGPATVLV
jgi:hypothetical protein